MAHRHRGGARIPSRSAWDARPQPHELEALTWAGLALGRRSSAIDYVRARRALTRATRDMAERFEEFDILLLPTTADHAPLTGQIDGRTAAFDLDRWNAESYGYAPYTELFNVTGQPAVSLPLAVSRDGLADRHSIRRAARRGCELDRARRRGSSASALERSAARAAPQAPSFRRLAFRRLSPLGGVRRRSRGTASHDALDEKARELLPPEPAARSKIPVPPGSARSFKNRS